LTNVTSYDILGSNDGQTKEDALTKIQKNSFVITVCVRYRKGMSIDSALADALDDHPEVTARQSAGIRKAAITELRKNMDWRYDKDDPYKSLKPRQDPTMLFDAGWTALDHLRRRV
jgi:hypothetical protein